MNKDAKSAREWAEEASIQANEVMTLVGKRRKVEREEAGLRDQKEEIDEAMRVACEPLVMSVNNITKRRCFVVGTQTLLVQWVEASNDGYGRHTTEGASVRLIDNDGDHGVIFSNIRTQYEVPSPKAAPA